MARIDRRQFVAGGLAGAAVAASAGRASAQSKTKLTIISHRVHQQTATEGPGGDVTKAWTDQNNATLEWVTLDLNAIHDRIFREAGLGSSDVAIDFVLNTRAVPEIMGLFEPIEPFMAKAPIEEFDDISQGMVKAFSSKGQRYGVPFRHAVNALHYNDTFLKERGFDRPPQVIDELLDYARKLTYTRPDGLKVHGWGFQADNYSDVVKLARAYGGDFITDDYKCVADSQGMVKALTLLKTMYAEGLIPKNITAMKQNDLITAMQTGQIAMTYFPFGRTVLFNDPKSSKFPGAFKLALPIVSKDMLAKGEVIASAEFWSMMIPKNSKNKELAWSLIRELSTKENTIREAVNGNGPVRGSAYADPRLIQMVPYAALEAKAIKAARVPMPAFNKAAEAKDVFIEEMQAAMLGLQEPEVSAKNMQKRIQPMLPA
ncbi:extracellular solute-binding protein [Alsobacter sp. SYSU M60028]|uniref:Extracellular solute-binding protein n=1 Tax=Alsobacter ponti TaxID=2962936 RepID=A0ABT1LAU9_9HYPH|nr:extracellular solute-binding protein [Alsobacter ponti]MCP8938569.1 extracellular solute-binding protein [Alsobacter ponti]